MLLIASFALLAGGVLDALSVVKDGSLAELTQQSAELHKDYNELKDDLSEKGRERMKADMSELDWRLVGMYVPLICLGLGFLATLFAAIGMFCAPSPSAFGSSRISAADIRQEANALFDARKDELKLSDAQLQRKVREAVEFVLSEMLDPEEGVVESVPLETVIIPQKEERKYDLVCPVCGGKIVAQSGEGHIDCPSCHNRFVNPFV